MKKEVYQFCPRCNSTDISPYYDTSAVGGFGSNFTQFQCNRCGNIGSFFPETDVKPELKPIDDVKKVKDEESDISKRSPVTNYYGFLSKNVYKYIGIFLFITSLIIPFYDKVGAYFALIAILPFSICLIALSYGKILPKKIKNIISILLVLSMTILPVVAFYLTSKL
jgi:hypothetical protein